MKNIIPLLIGSMMICGSLFLFSCKKQIAETLSPQPTAQAQGANVNECKPAVLGAFTSYGEWQTLSQKWYANGKVKFLKAMHGGWNGTFVDHILDYMFFLEWGEVSYTGNQVYLTDVTKNHVMLRVTLDNHGRPVASYYDYDPSPERFMHDTTYYYYNNDRLESIISLYRITYGSPFPSSGWRKFLFSYDSWGNVIKAEFPENLRYVIHYDYTKPVTGMMSNFHISSSLKLLEYLELLELPMHYAVTAISTESYWMYNPGDHFMEVAASRYRNYVIPDGLVRSYEYYDPYYVVTFYNGWECGTGASMNISNQAENAITNLKQFQLSYPETLIRK